MSKKPYEPTLVGLAEFANGARFRIDQITAKGTCIITDDRTKATSHSGSIPKAWASVRYQARINQRTENTSGWLG